MNIQQLNIVELAPLVSARTATLTGAAVGVQQYESYAQIILAAEAASAGTSPTLDVKLQECATSGGTYTDVSGATFAQVTDAGDVTEMIQVDLAALQQFVRVVGTIGGTATPTFTFTVSMVCHRKEGRNASQVV